MTFNFRASPRETEIIPQNMITLKKLICYLYNTILFHTIKNCVILKWSLRKGTKICADDCDKEHLKCHLSLLTIALSQFFINWSSQDVYNWRWCFYRFQITFFSLSEYAHSFFKHSLKQIRFYLSRLRFQNNNL